MSKLITTGSIVKVCGVTRLDDARAAIDFGATAIGLNFYPSSPRFLTSAQAKQLRQLIGDQALAVGVFVSKATDLVSMLQIAAEAELDAIQVHGPFPHSRADLQPFRAWRALPVDSSFSPNLLNGFDQYLLDTPSADHGGSGVSFDWNLIRNLSQPFIIAGGLDGSNVAAAISATGAVGADAASKLESAPGIKDHVKMKLFIDAARAALSVVSTGVVPR
jgi:phosphoribosylanthranilate isomerase